MRFFENGTKVLVEATVIQACNSYDGLDYQVSIPSQDHNASVLWVKADAVSPAPVTESETTQDPQPSEG